MLSHVGYLEAFSTGRARCEVGLPRLLFPSHQPHRSPLELAAAALRAGRNAFLRVGDPPQGDSSHHRDREPQEPGVQEQIGPVSERWRSPCTARHVDTS